MAIRVTEDEVRSLVDSDEELSLAPFIATANAVADLVDSNDADGVLTDAMLKEIEKYLSAHFYEHRDPQYTSRATAGASASFQGQFGMALDSSKWGQTAKMLDVTGYLASMSRGKSKAVATWLGKRPSEQVDYSERD